jgi:probable phosphomutase (TIGR03848 family)
MPIFLLVRHGENDYVKTHRLAGRLPGVHLNEKGRKQAQLLAERLAGAPIKAVYSSPLERAVETAQPLAEALGLEVMLRPNLIETDIGEWQDQKLWKLRRTKLWKVVQGIPSRMQFPGGESFADGQRRICQELEELTRRHEAKDVLVCVSHADPIKLAVAYFIGLPVDHFQRLAIAPGSITTLWLGEASSSLLNLNYEFSFTLPKS